MKLDDDTLHAIGLILLCLGILIGRFLHFEYLGFSVSDFAEGILIGLSLVLNLTYLIKRRLRK